ncbi:hypothetical protein MTP99_012836 [Tenebrio molitor]|jgi:hypothetical protein|nr:hypothetical protein MTP99_012836 [Tenebrio molitor]
MFASCIERDLCRLKRENRSERRTLRLVMRLYNNRIIADYNSHQRLRAPINSGVWRIEALMHAPGLRRADAILSNKYGGNTAAAAAAATADDPWVSQTNRYAPV